MDEVKLSGDEVSVASQPKYITKEVLSTLKTLVPNVDITEERIKIDFNGVPIVLDIKPDDYRYFQYPDFKFYWAMDYRIPNPFDEYWKEVSKDG